MAILIRFRGAAPLSGNSHREHSLGGEDEESEAGVDVDIDVDENESSSDTTTSPSAVGNSEGNIAASVVALHDELPAVAVAVGGLLSYSFSSSFSFFLFFSLFFSIVFLIALPIVFSHPPSSPPRDDTSATCPFFTTARNNAQAVVLIDCFCRHGRETLQRAAKKAKTATATAASTTKKTRRSAGSPGVQVASRRGAESPGVQVALRRSSRRTKEPLRAEDPGDRRVGEESAEGGRRGQKRKASEMAVAQASSVNPQVGAEALPAKRVTRAETRKQQEEVEGDGGMVMRSGKRRLGGAEGEHHDSSSGLTLTHRTVSSSSKRKSPFLDVPEHVLKRPASRRSVRSSYDGGDGVSDIDGYEQDEAEAEEEEEEEADGAMFGGAEEGERGLAAAARRKRPSHHHHDGGRAEEAKKQKLHPLLREGPDNPGFPWWHDDQWIKQERELASKRPRNLQAFRSRTRTHSLHAPLPLAMSKKQQGRKLTSTEGLLKPDTPLTIADDDDIASEEEAEPSAAPPVAKDPPRKLRSAARSTQPAAEHAQSAAPAAEAEAKKERPSKRLRLERYEHPPEFRGSLDKDPWTDERFLEFHRPKRDQEKAEHVKEVTREGKNFTRYMGLLSSLEEAGGGQWKQILGVDLAESSQEEDTLARKKERLVEELRAAKRRYPAYKAEREKVEQGDDAWSYAAWLKKNDRKPLDIKGLKIEREDWEEQMGRKRD
ncbi:hypothetical protein Dda_1294 [Drechslerella dactyloides]|uniref:Something about silencing protein 4 domain-containing protein n=1 Tax=Drechslerella dactyloides TaxID=74499 RepID=A0AAD6J5Z9_DREDA|nr:hypothetical protein Dda_1294 [Drechslerella dactyloides]